MVRKLLSIVLLGAFFIAGSGNYDTQAKIKAIYISRFPKYIQWPKEYRESTFVIGVLGESSMFQELTNMAPKMSVNGQKVEVVKFNSSTDISKCHMLYVPRDSKTGLSTVIGKISGFSTLLVTEKPGLATQGAAINFVVVQNRQKFELNEANAEKYNLRVSQSLEALAIVVN